MCYSSFSKTNKTKNGHGYAEKFLNFVLPKIKSVVALYTNSKKGSYICFQKVMQTILSTDYLSKKE